MVESGFIHCFGMIWLHDLVCKSVEQDKEDAAGDGAELREGCYWRQWGHVEKVIGLRTRYVGRGLGGAALHMRLSPGLAEGDGQTGINNTCKSRWWQRINLGHDVQTQLTGVNMLVHGDWWRFVRGGVRQGGAQQAGRDGCQQTGSGSRRSCQIPAAAWCNCTEPNVYMIASSFSCNSSERVGGSGEDPATPFVEEDGSDALVGEEKWWRLGGGLGETGLCGVRVSVFELRWCRPAASRGKIESC